MSTYDLEEDYEALYKYGSRPDPCTGLEIPVGFCSGMCSQKEMEERERDKRLSRFETIKGTKPAKVDENLAVAEFKRSSVGHSSIDPEFLRPCSVLKKTLEHLLLNICPLEDDWMLICDFVFDRLRAVRQEMVIQRIEGRRYIDVLEGSVRFLVYSMYRLSCTLKDYSSVEPLRRLIPKDGPVRGFDNYEMNVIREMKLTMKSLRDCLYSLICQYEDHAPDSQNRPLFEAINLLVNLPFVHGRSQIKSEYLTKRHLRNSDETFRMVFKIYCEHLLGNHLSALKRITELRNYPLLVVAYAPAIADLQIHMLNLLRKLYSAAGPNKSSLEHLCSLICPDWLEEDNTKRVAFCRFAAVQTGIYDEENDCCNFKQERPVPPVRPKDFVEKAYFEKIQDLKKVESMDTETRVYASQLIFSNDWSLYKSVLQDIKIEDLLRPLEDCDAN